MRPARVRAERLRGARPVGRRRDRGRVRARGRARARHASSTATTTARSSRSSATTSALEEGLVAGIDEARRRIDLRTHDGVHPRVGAADVVPVVPLGAGDLGRASTSRARSAGGWARSSGCRCSSTAAIGDGRRPAFFRRGGPDELQRRIDAGELAPAFGPRRLDPRGGRRARRRATAARRVQPRTARDARRRPRGRGGRARVVRRAARRAGARRCGSRAARSRSRRTSIDLDATAAARDGRADRRRGGGAWRGGGARRARRAAAGGERGAGRTCGGCADAARRPRRSDARCARGGGARAAPRAISTPTACSSGTSRG